SGFAPSVGGRVVDLMDGYRAHLTHDATTDRVDHAVNGGERNAAADVGEGRELLPLVRRGIVRKDARVRFGMMTAPEPAGEINFSIEDGDSLVRKTLRPAGTFAPLIGLRVEFRHEPVGVMFDDLSLAPVVPRSADKIDLPVHGRGLHFVESAWKRRRL